MPTPKPDESKSDYMEHCPGDVMGDGTTDDADQAVAICESMWDDRERAGTFASLRRAWGKMWSDIEVLLGKKRAWDGSASRYDSTDEYCSACLIDVNDAAGRDTKVESHCKLPVRDPGSDTDDFEGITAAAGGRGLTQVSKPDDVPQADWDKQKKVAANRIIAAYGKEDKEAPASIYEIAGKSSPEKERAIAIGRVFQRASMAIDAAYPQEWVYIHDIFQDGDTWFAIGSSSGNLYQYPLTVTESDVTVGERVQVIENFTPVQQTTVTRQADGRYRWLSVSATAVVNKDGEIDSTALFDDFERQSLEDDFVWPYRCFYHLGEQYRTGQVDFIARHGFALITSGIYDDTVLGRAEVQARLADPDAWRDSIHFQPSIAPDVIEVNEVKIPVHRAGGLIEVTTAPSGGVCSYGTTQTLMEVTRMEAGSRIHDAFLELFSGDEDAANKWLDDNPGAATRAVADGAVARTDGDADETPADDQGQQDEPPEVQRVDVDDELVDVIAGRVLDKLGADDGALAQMAVTLEAMGRQMEDAAQARIARAAQIDERLDALGRTDEERTEVIRQDMPRSAQVKVGYRPRVANSEKANGGDGRRNLADVAADTLSNMPARRTARQ